MTANPHHLVLEPAVQRFLESLDAGEQQAWAAVDAGSGEPTCDAVVEESVLVGCGEFGTVPVRIVRARGRAAALPAVVYLPGAGWLAAGAGAHDRLVADLARKAGVAVVFPQYGRADGARYPTALEQAYAIARWVCSDGHRYGLDPTRIAVAGDSWGANLALAVTLLTLRRNDFRFDQLVAFTPLTDTACDSDSCRQFAEGYYLRRDVLQRFWAGYLTDSGHSAEPTVAPLRAHPAELATFPPALIITAEADVVRDQGEAFAAQLMQAGAPTAAIRYEGTVHGFVALEALRDSTASRAAIAQAAAALQSALRSDR